MFARATSFNQPFLYCEWQRINDDLSDSTNVCIDGANCGWDSTCSPTDVPSSSVSPSAFPSDVPSVSVSPSSSNPTQSPTISSSYAPSMSVMPSSLPSCTTKDTKASKAPKASKKKSKKGKKCI